MSISKEPRQLMITLMYLVLTAMLALNVSAEILNAFLSMDESINESNQIVSESNAGLFRSIQVQAKAYPQYEKHEITAENAQQITKQFCSYIEGIKLKLIEATGGLDEAELPVGKKDKDTPTRIFVEEGIGRNLKDSVLATKNKLLNLIESPEDRLSLEKIIPLKIKAVPKNSDKKNWADFTFRQMPVAAVLPMLSKFQSDAQVAETSLLNYLAKKISAKPVHDEYKAMISADKSYVIRGEELNADIFLGAYSSTTDNISVKVNGIRVPVRNGKASFKKITQQMGDQELSVEVFARDPLSGDVKTYREKFKYEVGERTVTTSADKMNVFYVGVDNPFSVSAAGVSSQDVRVSASGTAINKIGNGKYNVKPTKPGKATITVSGGELPTTSFEYRVKPIPTPIAKLGNKLSGKMSPNEFKLYKEIKPILENFDFNANCKIIGYEMIRVDKHGDGFPSNNSGAKYNNKSTRFANQAQRGDKYYFENIKAKCPGDTRSRKLNSLFFKIQ